MKNLNLLLIRLLEAKIDFVLIGGYAAVVHGSDQVTQDLDICAVMSEVQLELLKKALHGLDPVHRMNPNFQPSLDEFPKIGQKVENYYLKTKSGTLDILGQVSPVGDFDRIKSKAISIKIFGYDCRVISLDDLIAVKSSMNRPKDQFVLQELLQMKNKKR